MLRVAILLFILINCTNKKSWIVITGDETIQVRIVTEEYELAEGLMFRRSLAPDSGMLFIFPRSDRYPFWMKNTEIPLAIAFIDDNNIIISIDTLIPHDTTLIYPPSAIKMALEVNRGCFSRKKIEKGNECKLKRSE